MTIRLSTITLLATLLGGPSAVPAQQATDAPVPTADPIAFVRGAQKWGNTCSRCHAMRDPKDLDDAQWQVAVAHMRARAGLTATDAGDIVRFLQQSNLVTDGALYVASAAVQAAPDGAALYKQSCVACHGNDGKGAIPGVPDLATRMSKGDADLQASILNGFQTKGSPMAMPAKGGNPKLTAEEAAALVAYLRSLAQK